MTIQTDYGMVEYQEEDLLIFRDGLFGFPQLTRYLLLRMNDEDDSILLMLSVEESKVVFVLINPFFLTPDYSPILAPEELSYYAICVVQNDYLENTVNLKCPLVINPKTRHGIQVILKDSAYGYRHKLGSFASITNPPDDQDGE